MSEENVAPEENKKPETKQKYVLITSDETGKEVHEVFDFKPQLTTRLEGLNQDAVRLVVKGRLLKPRIEERLVI